jgi:hypothetical protein
VTAGLTEVSEDLVEDVRLCIYRALAATGVLPPAQHLVDLAGNATRLAHCIEVLRDRRHVALDADGHIVLAHPFATRSFGYSVMSEDTLWWGGCAWDAFALAHLIPPTTASPTGEMLVATRCPACGRPLAWVVSRERPPVGPEIAHFLTPASRIWDDVIRTCSNQRQFCDDRCVDSWLEEHGHEPGYRMDLETLWRFASGWYAGRLDRGYQRKDPASALDYFRSAGLRGEFWGLPD